MSELVGLLLAAGFSRRYGKDKLKQQLPDGLWVAQRACRNLLAGVSRVVAVLRSEDELAGRLREEGAEIVICNDAHRGMGASLACGVRATANAAGWLIALGDMPWISPNTIRQVALALQGGASVVVPMHQGRRGHPVGFTQAFGPRLAALDGDTGAKTLLPAHAADIQLLPCDDAGILRDLDTPSDLQ